MAVRTEHRAANWFRTFQRHLAGQRGRSRRNESTLRADVPGRSAGHRGRHGDRAGSAEQRGRCDRRRESEIQFGLRARPAFLRISARESRKLVFRRSRSPPCPMASSMRRTSWSGASGSNISSERRPALQAQYVGTRAVNQPYLTQVNGYQTVCQGCFAPFPYVQPTDPRFGAVTQLSTGANSHYNGLQLTAMKRLGHGLQGQVNYTWSHCMDTVSNGGFLPFSAGGILSPLPGELARDYGPCDYDIRHNLNGQYVYQLPIKVRNHALGYALNGWQISGTVFWHSGVPFSVLSTPYSANGNGIVQGSGPQFASVVPGVPLYEHQSNSGRHAARHDSVAQSECVCLGGRSEHRSLLRRRHPAELPVRKSRPQRFARSRFLLERLLPHEMVSADRAREAADRRPVLQRLQPSELRTSEHRAGRHSRKAFHADRIRRADLHHLSADRPARRRIGRR